MVTTKGDHLWIDEELTSVRVECQPETVCLTIRTPLDWQATVTMRRADPDLRELAEYLLSCCEEVHTNGREV